jgi:hypothetical protein
MITYQADECFDSKKFIKACNQQGLVSVWRCPSDLKAKKDPEVLAEILPSGRTFLTTDRKIHFEHASSIPDYHSGILIIANTISPKTITIKEVMRRLSYLKSIIPDWHSISLRNSIVEIAENNVIVWRVVSGHVVQMKFLDYEQNDWHQILIELLKRNASSAALLE